MLKQNTFLTLLYHHWRRTWWFLPLPALLLVANYLVIGRTVLENRDVELGWVTLQGGILASLYILTLTALGLMVSWGSGEADAAMPRYARSLPVKTRRWSTSYIVYAVIVLGIGTLAVSLADLHVWKKSVLREETVAAIEYYSAQSHGRGSAISRAAAPPSEQSATVSKIPAMRAFGRRGAKRGVPRREAKPFRPVLHGPWVNYDMRYEPLHMLSVSLFCLALFLAITLIPWAILRVLAAGAVFVVPVLVFTMSTALQMVRASSDIPRDALLLTLYLSMLAAAVLIIHKSAVRGRHGGGSGRRLSALLAREVGRRPRRFTTPARALAWYDWMTFGRYLIHGVIAGVICIFVWQLPEGAARGVLTGLAVLPAAAFGGLYLPYRLWYGDRPEYDAYLVTLPVTADWLSRRRLLNIGKAVLAAWALGLFLEAWGVTGWFAALPRTIPLLCLTPVLAWVLVWMAGPLLYPAIVLWVVFGIIGVVLGGDEAGFVVASLLVAVLMVAALVWLVVLAKRRSFLRAWNMKAAALALPLSASLLLPVLLYSAGISFEHYFAGLALCLLSAVPFIGLPLAIDHYRHR